VVVLREGRVFDGCREAFAGGLSLGAPARQALRDAPRAVQVPFDQLNAEPVARAFWDRCLQHTPYIEPRELHQVFLALPTPGQKLTPALRAEADRLAAEAATHGFVAFAGVASSKLVARAAALFCKEGWLLWRPGMPARATVPETVRYVEPGAEAQFLASLPISYLPAPSDMARRLNRLGLKSIGEAARIPEGEWHRQLGPAGRQVALWSRGFDNEPVKPCYPPRTLEHRVAFTPDVQDRDLLEQCLNRAATALSRRLEGAGEGCQQVELTLERGSGPPVQVIRTLAKLQQSPYPIRQALQTLLAEALAQAGPGVEAGPEAEALAEPAGGPAWDGAVSALTAILGLIGPMPWQQMDLWDDGGRSEREERLERALALLQERFPSRMVGLGPRQDRSWREQMLTFNDPYRTGFSAGLSAGWAPGAPGP
jgi:DNA polymerase-4